MTRVLYLLLLLGALGSALPISAQLAQTQPAQTQPASPPTTPAAALADIGRSGFAFFDYDNDGQVQWYEYVTTIWTYPLFTTGDRVIRLNTLVVALLVILVGVWLASQIGNLLRRRLVRFSRVKPDVAAFVSKLTFYVLVVLVIMIVLPVMGIPITVFTVLGGALAIGIGFGAQTLISNLISGLILMIEKPIRLGDIIVVDDHEGRVMEIGNRATRIRRVDGVDVLVPNSHLLERSIANLTLVDAEVRSTVAVGVAYGSPTGQVAKLLRQAVDTTRKIRQDRPIDIVFADFGDNALVFHVYFWSNITAPMDRRRLESALRFRIDALFREAGIAISFPQRDVHLDTLRPLEVQLTRQRRTQDDHSP